MRIFNYLAVACLFCGSAFASSSFDPTGTGVNQQPVGVTINNYDLLLTVGMDEALNANAVGNGITGFETILGWNQTTIDQFRAAAAAWFLERFGIDFVNGATYDPSSGITFNSIGLLIPIYFEGSYRVLSSNNDRIEYTRKHPSTVRLAEYVVIFNNGAVFNYGGTYANGTPIAGNDTDNLAFGCYRIFVKESLTNYYDFFMRSYYPDATVPLTSTANPPRSFERFQMYSPHFGPGFGILNVAVPQAADSSGKYPTYTRASWSFPGSFEIPDWNGYTTAPVSP